MVAYSFKTRFAEPILARTKTQTIRAYRCGRSRHVRIGETIQIYTGLRTKQTKLLGFAEARLVFDIRLALQEGCVWFPNGELGPYLGNGLDDFARMDGFRSWPELVAFWEKEHRQSKRPNEPVFEGVWIYWSSTFVPATRT